MPVALIRVPSCIVAVVSTDVASASKSLVAVSDVIVECAKRSLSEKDFQASIADLSLSAEHQTAFSEVLVFLDCVISQGASRCGAFLVDLYSQC